MKKTKEKHQHLNDEVLCEFIVEKFFSSSFYSAPEEEDTRPKDKGGEDCYVLVAEFVSPFPFISFHFLPFLSFPLPHLAHWMFESTDFVVGT